MLLWKIGFNFSVEEKNKMSFSSIFFSSEKMLLNLQVTFPFVINHRYVIFFHRKNPSEQINSKIEEKKRPGRALKWVKIAVNHFTAQNEYFEVDENPSKIPFELYFDVCKVKCLYISFDFVQMKKNITWCAVCFALLTKSKRFSPEKKNKKKTM